MRRDIQLEVVYPHPPERVWRALTDPAAVSEWLMPNDFQPRLGHKFTLKAKPRGNWDGIVNCEVLEVTQPRRLAYTWQGGPLTRATVSFTLEPTERGTRLAFEHNGFEGFQAVALSVLLQVGWSRKLRTELKAAIGRGE